MRLTPVAVRLTEVLAVMGDKPETRFLARAPASYFDVCFDQNGIPDAVLRAVIGGKARNRPVGDALLDRGAGRDRRLARQ